MRRKDLLFLIAIALIITYAVQQLRLPVVAPGSTTTIDSSVLATFSKWSTDTFATTAEASGGQVLGASTDTGISAKPESLLTVETYYGAPFVTSLEAMLQAVGVTVYGEDVVEAFPLPELGLGSTIHIYRATPIEVTDWGKKKTYRTWQKTVQGFFTEQGIELGENDKVDPKLDATLSLADDQQAHIVIARVTITEVKQEEKIDYKVKESEDPNLPWGQKNVTKGEAGKRQKIYQVTRENGVEVKRVLLKNEIIKEPKDEIVVIGTKLIYGEIYKGRASWYKYNSTKVATDHFKRGVWLEITNLSNGKKIRVKNDGCICADTGYVVDLHPDHFTALGGKISDGVIKSIQIAEIKNYTP